MSLSRTIARPMLASVFLVGATNALKNSGALAAKAQPVTDRVGPIARKALPVLPQDLIAPPVSATPEVLPRPDRGSREENVR